MNVNLNLKAELMRRFGSQVEAARQMGIRENRLSYIVRGHTEPSERERKALEDSLGKALVRRLLGGATLCHEKAQQAKTL